MGKAGKTVGARVGLAAIAAGTYFLYGKDGAKNREKVRGWALKAKGEMLQGLEKMRTVNKDTYDEVIDRVAKRYKKFKEVDSKELKKLVNESKGFWTKINKYVSSKTKNGAPKKKSTRKHKRSKTA